MNILVLDVGTSGMRGVLYDNGGKARFTHRVRYSVRTSGGLVEQPAGDWGRALIEICQQAAEQGDRIDALSLTSQRSSVIPLDRGGTPLRDAIMWQDTRNAPIVKELSPQAGRITALTGARLNTVFSGTKMTWFRRNEPDLYAKTFKLCTIADYITFLITGNFVTDETYGSRSLLMGLKSRKWESELLELFEVEEEKLCRLTEPGSISGTVTAEFSQKTGIPAGIPLISAGGDQQCGALGQGLLEEGAMTVTLGTSACILKCAGSIPEELNGVICGAHAIPRRFVLEGSMLTCGATFDWVRRTFFSEGDFTAVNQAVSASPPGANGVIVLPYFQGRGTPDWNSGARGGFLNLSLSATRADMVRAALEAVVYEIVNEIEIMEAMGPTGDTIRAGGGATNSLAFCGMLADASGKTVLSGDNTEGTAFGAWMNAAVTLGVCADYAEAFGIAGEETARSTTRPRPENYRIYSIGRERMNEMYLKIGLV